MAKKKKGRSRFVTLLIIIILIGAAGAAGGYVYGIAKNDIEGKRQEKTEYTLVITKNDFEYEIGKKLYNNKIVVSDMLWTNWMSKHYPKFKYINGEYKLTADMSYEEIAKKLQNPDISHEGVKVAIPEGYNVMEIAKRLEENGVCKAADFLEVCKSTDGFDYDFLKTVPDNDLIIFKLEGFLFPATYDLEKNMDAREVAEYMLETFESRMTDDMDKFCKENDMTIYDLLSLASVVQEEALGQNSAKNIASTLMNRLSIGMKLQCDVTNTYGDMLEKYLTDVCGYTAEQAQEVFDAYYTYNCEGLPAGPITNSGSDIIDAVVNYPETDYLFFFSDLEGDFHFAKDDKEFEELKSKYPWKAEE